MWRKVEIDPQYRDAGAQHLGRELHRPAAADDGHAGKGAASRWRRRSSAPAKAVATLRARGVRVVFVRPPSDGAYYAFEQKAMPRAQTWDVLLQRTGAPGIHFEDYPQLQGYELPEWSHLTAADAARFTAQLQPLVEREFQRLEAGARAQPAATSR